jgi:hypothetical protein
VVVRQSVKNGEQKIIRGSVAVLVLDGEVLRYLVNEGVRIKIDEQAKEEAELGRTEDSRGRVEDAVEFGNSDFLQLLPLGLFGFPLLLLAFEDNPAFFGLTFPLLPLTLLLLAMAVFLFLGLLLNGLGYSLRLLDDDWACNWLGRGLGGIVDGAIVLGANAQGSADALAIHDERGYSIRHSAIELRRFITRQVMN